MELTSATWTDVAGCETSLAIVPVGSTEQHGPHAPLGTDALAAEAVAEAGADRYDGETVVTPVVPIGIAEEHRHFPGTMWVSPDTFRAYVRDAAASLAAQGFDRIVFVNGHGGNVDALREVAADLSRHEDAYAVAFTWFEAVPDADRMGHGGPLETALIRHLAPGLIREDRVDDAREGAADGWGEWVSGTNLAHDSAAFTDNGAVGDPGDGDEALGAELLEAAATALAELLDAVAGRDVSAPASR